jgi:threonine/homoserine/homoserine lactone efflux protein
VSPAGTLLAFFALELALCAVPGPAVLFTVGATLRRGVRGGAAAAAGIVAGNTAYFALSGLGVVALVLASYRAFTLVKYAGAAYLAYLGLRALFGRADAGAGAAAARAERAGETARRTFAAALTTQLANPKAIVFFAAVVPQFVDVRGDVVPQVAALALVSAVAESGTLAVYVALAERLRRSGLSARARAWLERAGGALLVALAARIAREPFVATP